MMQKIICLVVAISFLVSNIAYGLSPAPASRVVGEQSEILRYAQEQLAGKIGPSALANIIDTYGREKFAGRPSQKVRGVKFIKTDYKKLLRGWPNALSRKTFPIFF